jgi:hypothetical protein
VRYSSKYWNSLYKAAHKNDQARKIYKLLCEANKASEAAAIITPIEAIVKRDCAKMCDEYDVMVEAAHREMIEHAIRILREGEMEIEDDEDGYFSLATNLTDIV